MGPRARLRSLRNRQSDERRGRTGDYLARSPDAAGGTDVKRVSLEGGAPTTLATLPRTDTDDLVLHGDALRLMERDRTTGRSHLVSVPKKGGAPSVLADGISVATVAVHTSGDVYVAVDTRRGARRAPWDRQARGSGDEGSVGAAARFARPEQHFQTRLTTKKEEGL